MPAGGGKSAAQIKRQKLKDANRKKREAEAVRREHELHGDPGRQKDAEMNVVCQKLAAVGRTMVPVPADGNCMFAALSQQCDEILGRSVSIEQLRHLTADHIEAFADHYAPFFTPSEEAPTLAAHCEAVRKSPATWGSMMELSAAAKVLGARIAVVSAAQPHVFLQPEEHSTCVGTTQEITSVEDGDLCVVFLEHAFTLGAHYNGSRRAPGRPLAGSADIGMGGETSKEESRRVVDGS